jgi:DNA-binding CsgD family transcriptional regulator
MDTSPPRPDRHHAGLVGREAELSRVDTVLAGLPQGGLCALAVHGEPGIGKTALLDEVAARARRLGLAVYAGRATEFEQDLPLAVYTELLSPLAMGPPAAGDRRHAYHVVRDRLAAQAATRPIVVVLDDLHWADPSSLELTEYLLRRPVPVPVLVVLAYRSHQAPAGVTNALSYLGDAASRIGLGPLDAADLARLLPGVDPARCLLLHRVSRGNPLYVRALADATDQTLSDLSTGRYQEPEQAILATIRVGLDGLDHVQLLVARSAAIAGDGADVDLVAEVAARSAETVTVALDELHRRGLLAVSGTTVRFRHPLIRNAAYWSVGPAARTRGHARAAAYLRTHGGPRPLLAHHVQRSARYGDEPAARMLAEAAAATLNTAPVTATELLETALRILPDRDELADRRTELQCLLAQALIVTGRLERCGQLLHQLVIGRGAARWQAVALLSLVYRLTGRYDETVALLDAELGAGVEPGVAIAKIHLELSAAEVLRHDPHAALRHANRAVEATEAAGDRALTAAVHTIRALAYLHEGRTGPASLAADRAARSMDSATDDELCRHIELAAPLAWVETQLGRAERAARHLRRGVDIAERNGCCYALPYLSVTAAMRHAWHGRLPEAVVSGQEALAAAAVLDSQECRAMAAVTLLLPTLWQHGPQRAQVAADLLVRAGLPRSAWWAELARRDIATVYLAAGQASAALDMFEDARAVRPGTDVYVVCLRAEAGAATGDRTGGVERLAHAIRLARASGVPHQLGTVLATRARLLADVDGLSADGLRDARDATAHFAAAGTPVEEGRARQLLARHHAAGGDVAAARVELGCAKEIFAACSATWLTRRAARDELRLAARQPRPARGGDGLGMLTDREREVAVLAGAGLTNREIATAVRLSQKTVEAHLSRAFAKVGVRSRTGLARRIAAETNEN